MARLSKIARMPAELRELIGRLREQGRTIDEIREHLSSLDVEVTRATLGRHVQRIDAIAARVRESRAAAEAIVSRLGTGDETRTARLNIELMHASVMQLLAGEEGQSIVLDPENAMLLARTLRDLSTAARHDAEREIKVRREVAKEAAKAATGAARKAGLKPDTIARIEREVLGIAAPGARPVTP